MGKEPAACTAAILHAGYLVRNYPRPHQRELRRQALALMAQAARAGLEIRGNEEATLQAIADGLKPD